MDKKRWRPNFDISRVSCNGNCELVGLYILHVFIEKYGEDKTGLYHDDSLACFRNINRSQAEWIRKEFILKFKTEFKLSIINEKNLKILNFLDVTLNLNTGTHELYNKPNNNPLYINNINSNHSPNIIRNLPENIQKRISKLSNSISIFNFSKDLYNNTLFASGFQQRIKFEQGNTSAAPIKNRKRNIIWFKPLYSANVTIKIGNKFLQILNNHFPKSYKFHILFNHNLKIN